jgi:hypothetical protein
MKATICVGVSASGKTTWAKEQENSIIISRDDIRKKILMDELHRELEPGELWKMWKFKREPEVNIIQDMEFKAASELNMNVIVADTNLNKDFNQNLETRLKALDYEIEYKLFPVDLVTAWNRDKERADSVGYDIIYRQYQQWLKFIDRKIYTPNIHKPSTIIVDVDGTLAHMTDRGAFDWLKVGQDTLDPAVYYLVLGFYQQGFEIIILSGRDSICREETIQWLNRKSVPFNHLYMRREGDRRKDSVVKEELFWEYIADDNNVIAVVDDRPQVTRLWRELGLKVFDVGDPYKEF